MAVHCASELGLVGPARVPRQRPSTSPLVSDEESVVPPASERLDVASSETARNRPTR
jgi:hypothetical protein